MPLTLGINNYADGEVALGTNNETLTLQPGTYLLSYSGNITDTTGNSGLAFYRDGVIIPATQSQQTVNSASDTVNLSNVHVITLTETAEITLRNTGANSETVTNLNANIIKLA